MVILMMVKLNIIPKKTFKSPSSRETYFSTVRATRKSPWLTWDLLVKSWTLSLQGEKPDKHVCSRQYWKYQTEHKASTRNKRCLFRKGSNEMDCLPVAWSHPQKMLEVPSEIELELRRARRNICTKISSTYGNKNWMIWLIKNEK